MKSFRVIVECASVAGRPPQFRFAWHHVDEAGNVIEEAVPVELAVSALVAAANVLAGQADFSKATALTVVHGALREPRPS